MAYVRWLAFRLIYRFWIRLLGKKLFWALFAISSMVVFFLTLAKV